MRELTNAELDFVGGGALSIIRKPTEPPIVKLVEEIIVDVLKLLEGNQPGRPMQAQKA
jgi:hypothetical protein